MPQCNTKSTSLAVIMTRLQFRKGYEQAAQASKVNAIAPWPIVEYDKLNKRDQGLYETGRLFAVCTKGKFQNLFPVTAKELRRMGDVYNIMLKNWTLHNIS